MKFTDAELDDFIAMTKVTFGTTIDRAEAHRQAMAPVSGSVHATTVRAATRVPVKPPVAANLFNTVVQFRYRNPQRHLAKNGLPSVWAYV